MKNKLANTIFSMFFLVFCSSAFADFLVNKDDQIYRIGPPLFASTSAKSSSAKSCGSLCCLSRESCDSGRRICPVYRVRQDSCEKGEETVEMKFCNGPF
jgi:hypothetical protein